ncbi:MAG: T9SS type A sorting domain-containing protein [Saprospiraceae bacterium]|nr:T9SS type A sorting domain-containing protein [Saprospiraceae bacterium]
MKKTLFFLSGWLFYHTLMAQPIADPNFAEAIRLFCSTCIDNANQITDDGRKLTSLTIAIRNINDITGITAFSSLTSLNCGNNNLTFIPALPVNLQTLHISNNKLKTLANLPQNLRNLYCKNNQLQTLPSNLPPNLRILDCSDNVLTALPASLPQKLESLLCSNNLIGTLPPLPQSLGALVCANNKLDSLPTIPPNLSLLSCQNNDALRCLPKLPDSLAYLYISKNITCLPNKVSKASILSFEGIVSQPVSLPICSDLKNPPCPPLPKDTSVIVEHDLKIYPNPTEGYIRIDYQGLIYKIEVINYLGQTVMYPLANEINISGLASGYYIIKIESDKGTHFEKIIRQ